MTLPMLALAAVLGACSAVIAAVVVTAIVDDARHQRPPRPLPGRPSRSG